MATRTADAFPTTGMPREEIFAQLNAFKKMDLPWKSGRILAYTYEPGQEAMDVAADAYRLYLSENGLDPTTFPSMHRLETDIVHMLR